ncbi:MAG: hypothetical protein UX16_C0003G0027 [Parcubacteria group bacterium GW2011_GWB1_45_7]|nr:MAG: hypothetical protein UX16_C0003G0027 [Parcubacteria group bacterium GW2011_GWB1_45_7]
MLLNNKSFGLAGGAVAAVSVLVSTWVGMWTGYLADFALAVTKVYPGASLTFLGSIWGAVFAFVYAFVGFYLFAWLYNRFAGRKR